MINLDYELAEQYLVESQQYLAAVEARLLLMEKGGPEIDEELMNRAFRAVCPVEAGAGLEEISDLAQRTNDLLALIHSREMLPTPERVRVLLGATRHLQELIHNAGESRPAGTAETIAELSRVLTDHRGSAAKKHAFGADPERPGGGHLRVLLVEDDFSSRLLLQTFLSGYGECHVAVNGLEALAAFGAALERGERYDLICMDIMMPEMDGREAVRRLRALEEVHGILSTSGAKIIMTTAVDDIKTVSRCFEDLCDGYLTKPIDLAKLLAAMKSYQLIH